MSGPKHTPGPWFAYSEPLREGALTVGPHHRQPVATIHARGVTRTERHKANARLLAAAWMLPEVRNALVTARLFAKARHNDDLYGAFNDLLERLDAALGETKGGVS